MIRQVPLNCGSVPFILREEDYHCTFRWYPGPIVTGPGFLELVNAGSEPMTPFRQATAYRLAEVRHSDPSAKVPSYRQSELLIYCASRPKAMPLLACVATDLHYVLPGSMRRIETALYSSGHRYLVVMTIAKEYSIVSGPSPLESIAAVVASANKGKQLVQHTVSSERDEQGNSHYQIVLQLHG